LGNGAEKLAGDDTGVKVAGICARPKLSVVTNDDKKLHGTVRYGENHPHAKLTEKQVCDLLAMEGTVSWNKMGKKLGVHPNHIGTILAREAWSYLQIGTKKGKRGSSS
jgi:hypothetical protein